MTAPRAAADRTATFVAAFAVVFAATVFGLGFWLREAPPLVIPHPSTDAAAQSSDALLDPMAGDDPAERDSSQALAPDLEGPHTATLDVHVQIAGEARLQRVVFAVVDRADRTVATAEQRGLQEEFSAVLTVPADVWLMIGATTWSLPDDLLGTHVMPVRTRLSPGEKQRIELQASAAPTTLRVVGPSTALLSHLALEVVLRDQHGMPFRTPLGADGSIRVHLPEAAVRASLLATGATKYPLQDANGRFDLLQRGGEVVLAPAAPLVGLLVGTPGKAVPAALSFDHPAGRSEIAACRVIPAAKANEGQVLHGWTPELGPFTLARDQLVAEGDQWFADPRLVTRLAALLVHVAAANEPGAKVPAEATTELDLLAEPLPDGTATKLERDQTNRSAALPAGDYRLVWNVRGGRGPIAVERLTLRAGEATDLHLQPPPLQRWTVQLRGVDADRSHVMFLTLGGVHSLGGARDGAFLLDLAEPPPRDGRGEVFSWVLKASFPATVVAVDHGSRRAEVTSPLSEARWIRIRVQPMANGQTFLRLQRTSGLETRFPAMLDGDATLPLLPGTSRAGCALEVVEGRHQLTAWFRVEPGNPDLLVQGQGRWSTLHLERPIVRATVSAAGPDEIDPIEVFSVDRAGDYPIFVAEGTRQFHIDLEPGGRVSLDANAALVVR